MRLGPIGRRGVPDPHLASAAGWTAHLAGAPGDDGAQPCARCASVLTDNATSQYWPVGSWVAVEDLDRAPSDYPYRSLASRHFMIGLGVLAGSDDANAISLLDWEVRGGSVCVAVASDG